MNKKTSISILLFTLAFSLEAQGVTEKFKDAFRSEALQVNGYGQIIANYSQNPDRGMAKTSSNCSFDVARAIIFAQGRLGENRQFGYMLMYDFGPGSSMHELYGEWLPKEAFNLRFGQFKVPFTIENPMSPTRNEAIYFSRSVQAMAGSAGDYNQYGRDGAVSVKGGRDAGLQVSGKLFRKDDFHQVEYYAGLFNGTGLNTKDNNNRKDFVGTIYYQPLKGLKAGGSVYSGEITLADSVAGLNAGSYSRKGWTAGAVYDAKRCYIRSEYIANRTGSISREGYYATAVWKFVPGRWEVFGKYDYYDADKSVADNETQDITFGLNYYMAWLTRIQLNYIHTDDRALGKNNAVAAQLQLYF